MPNFLDQAKEALGELFIIGFNGPELSDETAAFISQAGIGGVLINSQNYESPAQLAELSNQIQECRQKHQKGLPLWIAVDHEGGKVQRFKKHFTKIPEAAAIGAMNSPKLAFEIAEVMAKELKAVGINLNLAPVVDIATNPRNPAIGTRAFGSDEDTVSKMTSGMLRGHLVNGIQACVKHFPGHGDTSNDSHHASPRVDTPLETLREREFKPFLKAFKSHCPMTMTAHVIYTQLDPDRPATFSRKILQEYLREELRFSKIILSDEMEMRAVTDRYSAEEAPILALEAGCDILLYKNENSARAAYASVLKALESGRLKAETILQSANRIRSVKQSELLPYSQAKIADVGMKIGIPEHQAIVAKVTAPAEK